MVRNGDGYDFYYYLNDGLDNGDGTYSPAWVDTSATPVDTAVTLGGGFWIYDPYNASASYTTAGAVCADTSVEVNYVADFNLAGNPYPVAFGFSDVTWDGMVGVYWDVDNEWVNTAPQIMVRNGEGYNFYYFLTDGLDNGDGTYSPSWVDESATPVSGDLIEAGAAFWFKPTTAVKATYTF